jgi:hypothetical protein
MSQCLTLGGPCCCTRPRAFWCPSCQRYVCRAFFRGHSHLPPGERELTQARHSLLNWLIVLASLAAQREEGPAHEL